MSTSRKVLVSGAGGFIGHHLVSDLKAQGHWVRGVDLKHPEYAATEADEFSLLDLREIECCLRATRGIDTVFALAADMGGMGFISQNHSQIFYNNALINLHTLEAARRNGVERYLFSSSACQMARSDSTWSCMRAMSGLTTSPVPGRTSAGTW